jgi:hypothetical protein
LAVRRKIVQPEPDAALETAPADLSDSGEQARLAPVAAKAAERLTGFWQLATPEICALLGGISDRSWYRMKAAPPAAMGQDMLTRISVMTGIFKGLRILFSLPLADQWVRRPNRDPIFAGRTPLDAMIAGGIPKMLEVRAYIDALRGGL